MDLHFKMILREFRSFFVEELWEKFNYIVRKKKKSGEFYSHCIIQLLKNLGFADPSQRLVFFLGALMYPKDAKACLKILKPKDMKRKEAIQYIDLIH